MEFLFSRKIKNVKKCDSVDKCFRGKNWHDEEMQLRIFIRSGIKYVFNYIEIIGPFCARLLFEIENLLHNICKRAQISLYKIGRMQVADRYLQVLLHSKAMRIRFTRIHLISAAQDVKNI